MRSVSKDGKVWFEKKGNQTNIGFTQAFLNELDGCWHMVPAASKNVMVKDGQPLCAVETNDGLFSVPSPCSGLIAVFNNQAMNFPDKLTAEDVIASMKDEAAVQDDFVDPGRPVAADGRVAPERPVGVNRDARNRALRAAGFPELGEEAAAPPPPQENQPFLRPAMNFWGEEQVRPINVVGGRR